MRHIHTYLHVPLNASHSRVEIDDTLNNEQRADAGVTERDTTTKATRLAHNIR